MNTNNVFTEKAKQAISRLNAAIQTHIVLGISDGIVTSEMAIKIANFVNGLPDGAQQVTVARIISGKIKLED